MGEPRITTTIDTETEEWLYSSNTLTLENEPPAAADIDTTWLKALEIEALRTDKKKKVSRREVWGKMAWAM